MASWLSGKWVVRFFRNDTERTLCTKSVDIRKRGDILGLDILGLDILGLDILEMIRRIDHDLTSEWDGRIDRDLTSERDRGD